MHSHSAALLNSMMGTLHGRRIPCVRLSLDRTANTPSRGRLFYPKTHGPVNLEVVLFEVDCHFSGGRS
jgi:hypothetical protein